MEVALNNPQLRMFCRLLDKLQIHELALESEGAAVVVTFYDEAGHNLAVTIDEDGRATNGR